MAENPQNTANSGRFQPGNPGRQPGQLNKLTRTVKETVLAVFNDLQDDPKVNLAAWAKTEPTEFYKIAAKLIPQDIKAKVETDQIQINLIAPAGD